MATAEWEESAGLWWMVFRTYLLLDITFESVSHSNHTERSEAYDIGKSDPCERTSSMPGYGK